MAIQRRSYRMPKKNEGNKSPKERSLGLNAKKVANLNKVKINRKIEKRLTTQRMVFGIFNLISMAGSIQFLPFLKKDYKRREFQWFQQR
jgi:hypothetical protein